MVVAALLVALFALPTLAGTAAAYTVGHRRRGDAGTEPLRARGAVFAFLREWLASVALLATWPFRLRARLHESAARRVAVFVPELHCSSASFWYLRRRLRACGWSSAAGMPRTGRGRADAIAGLDAQIAALPSGVELVLVGHGLGGLVAHDYAEARPDLRVRHVITLGTPHQGSRGLPYRVFGAATATPAAAGARVDVIAIYSDFDAWLLPVDDAYCPGGFNIAVRGVGHCAMLLSRRVADLIAENLAAPAPQTGAPQP
jgi:pimeloyl-ACP methyl ester carboxylesterase